MRNPFLINRTNTLTYITAWILIAGIHAVILWLAAGQELRMAVSDSLIFNVLFAGIALGLWYSIRYYDFNKGGFMDRLWNHLFISMFVLGVWLGLGFVILNSLWSDQSLYQEFLAGS